ncbi:hypothetical protein [Streptomyces resistomycificus]|uniref:hypothetical protein n=1 Tax=Streptomyces resistomycificus TaxID=67356 RepID=UPI00068C9AB1|nr:hypothetical protein [Streptomyces resistomycificus]KUO01166.1 hypothetical protein AQJ84_01545 [Streptomyces resistomycificus]
MIHSHSFDGCGQEGMLVDADRRDDIVRRLGAEQDARGQEAGIIADESTGTVTSDEEVPRWLSQPGTARYVDRPAHHTHDNSGDANRVKVHETSKAAGAESWATEVRCFGKGGTGWAQGYDPGIDGGLNLSRIIDKDFATAHDSAFLVGRPVGDDRQRSVREAKFVKPGSVAHDVPDGVEVSAYDRNGTWVVVADGHHTTDTALNPRFNSRAPVRAGQAVRTSADENRANVARPSVRGGTVSASLPARSWAGRRPRDGSEVSVYSCNGGSNQVWFRQ